MTPVFTYIKEILHTEEASLANLAEQYGTPLYVYSRRHMTRQYQSLVEAMQAADPLVCYSVKANSNLSVIRTFLDMGAGLDIVSGGELFRALQAGARADRIVFAGVGKTQQDIEYALREGILFFTVESEAEALRISECAQRTNTTARIAFRVNPDVDPKTHRYISTGKKENKFGMNIERTRHACATAAQLPGIELAGLHLHIGSQILKAQPFAEAIEKVLPLLRECISLYPSCRYLDIGGGIGIPYQPEQPPLDPSDVAARILPLLSQVPVKIVMEPGRFLVGNAGVLLCRVQYIKNSEDKTFIVTDAAMNDLIRPCLYEAYHEILPVRKTRKTITGDMVGPICESGDFMAKDRLLPAAQQDDLLAIMSAGAYGFTMSSNYNSRPRAAEVLVDGATIRLIRKRETWDDLIEKERCVKFTEPNTGR